MNEIIFVFCDDWQAIYVNGELKIENHEITADVAMGSLITTKDEDISIPDKIKKALVAAETYCCGVQRPFRIIIR